MELKSLDIDGVFVMKPIRHVDNRGFFSETWNKKELENKNIFLPDFVQDNHSMSKNKGSVRGLHFQAPPFAQSKLIRCGRGSFLDVAVDIRKGSPSFGRWVSEELSFENAKQLYIPEGFLHGFVTLEPNTEVIYKCSNYYDFGSDGSIRFDDPDIGINWPLDISKIILSKKDRSAIFLRDLESPFFMETSS